jgi:hypothetical protein
VGFFPVFFPPEGCFGHAPVQAQPGPIDAFQAIVFQQAGFPHRQEHALLNPLLEAVVSRGAGAELGGVEGFPLAARTEDEEDGIHTGAIRGSRLATAEGVRIHVLGD